MNTQSGPGRPKQLFQISNILFDTLEKFIGSSVDVEGEENLQANPTLFMVNHFTRIETVILPHILYRLDGQQVHSLAHSAFFSGRFGDFLNTMGAISTKDPQRDNIIISELMKGSHNWVIYPEGSMVKNKKVMHKGKFRLELPNAIRTLRTGAAVLVLKAFLLKKAYKEAMAKGDDNTIGRYQELYHLRRGVDDLSPLDPCIVPVNISYYPLRPGKSFISEAVRLLLKELPPQVEEELLVEGKLLTRHCNITISFQPSIDLRQFSRHYRRAAHYLLPFVSHRKRRNIILNLVRHPITRLAMKRAYTGMPVNMDHLVATALRHLPAKGMDIEDFKRLLFLAIIRIRRVEGYRMHPSLDDRTVNLVTGEDFTPFTSMMRLVEEEGVMKREGSRVIADCTVLKKKYLYQRIRIDNTTRVIANEFEVMSVGIKIIKKMAKSDSPRLIRKTGETVAEEDRRIFEEERMRSFEVGVSKGREHGRPRHLQGDREKPGLVLCHGFLASPGELTPLADFLHQKGYGVYLVRLAGHGTHPAELDKINYQSWLTSFGRGYAVMKHSYPKVIFGGFSAGALVALIKSTTLECAGVFAINPALIMKGWETSLVPAVAGWNHLLEALSVERGQLPWVEHHPENPDTNYEQVYLDGILALRDLAENCRDVLSKVKAPLQIIQGTEDPVIDVRSAKEILKKVSSLKKDLKEIPFERHVIVDGERSQQVFKEVARFVDTLTYG